MTEAIGRQLDKALFDAAMGLPDAAVRREFLRQACGPDEARFARIIRWLDASSSADKFFRDADVARVEVSAEVGRKLADAPPPTVPESGPGSWIGGYHLLERIGEGGWGVIYLAEQSEPVRRRVALKVLQLGLEAGQAVARFELERQAQAMMEHPNIAQVLDAGTTAGGRPYFVMELVLGDKITEHCDQHRLGVRQRLEMFIQVCDAIQHAHQKGIIHRDIKPSNVLVSSGHDRAIPKVIDFGIARVTEGRLAEHTQLTSSHLPMGTPAYMSPEQAEGDQGIDTRSDVYSLGVLLCELLTGTTPIDGDRLAKAGLLEMLRILREVEPPVPSALLAALPPEAQAAAARARGVDAARLISSVRGELDWIVVKATAKEREHRYHTVNGLAQDIRRCLNDEPVFARPQGSLYLFRKLVRRHKAAFAAAIVVLCALVAGVAISSWFYFREKRAMQEQTRLREIAEIARANETRLLDQSKARESVSLAAMLLSEGKTEEADAMLAKMTISSIEPSLEAASVYRQLGDWNAIRRRWPQAADCYMLYLRANRLDRSRVPQGGLLVVIGIAPALMLAEHLDEYAQFREDALLRYGRWRDPVEVAILLKSCLLAPVNDEQLAIMRPWADALKRSVNGLDANQSAFAAFSLGLMAHRSGDAQGTLDWARNCLASPNANKAREAAAHALVAMAAHRLGQADLARSELGVTQQYFASPAALSQSPRGDRQGYWQDWAIAEVMLRETQAAIGSADSPAR